MGTCFQISNHSALAKRSQKSDVFWLLYLVALLILPCAESFFRNRGTKFQCQDLCDIFRRGLVATVPLVGSSCRRGAQPTPKQPEALKDHAGIYGLVGFGMRPFLKKLLSHPSVIFGCSLLPLSVAAATSGNQVKTPSQCRT